MRTAIAGIFLLSGLGALSAAFGEEGAIVFADAPPGLVRLDVKDSTVGDVLASLGGRFDIAVEQGARPSTRPLSGHFEGRLVDVVEQMLQHDGHVVVLGPADGDRPRPIVKIIISAPREAHAAPTAASPSPPSAVTSLLQQAATAASPGDADSPDSRTATGSQPDGSRTAAATPSAPIAAPAFGAEAFGGGSPPGPTGAPAPSAPMGASRPLRSAAPLSPGIVGAPGNNLAQLTAIASFNVQALVQALANANAALTASSQPAK